MRRTHDKSYLLLHTSQAMVDIRAQCAPLRARAKTVNDLQGNT